MPSRRRGRQADEPGDEAGADAGGRAARLPEARSIGPDAGAAAGTTTRRPSRLGLMTRLLEKPALIMDPTQHYGSRPRE